MRKLRNIAKKAGAILLIICLVVASGYFSEFASSFGRKLLGEMTAKAADGGTGDGASGDEWHLLPLYNFAKIWYYDASGAKKIIGSNTTFFRMNRTSIRIAAAADPNVDPNHFGNDNTLLQNKDVPIEEFQIVQSGETGYIELFDTLTGTEKFVAKDGKVTGYSNSDWNYVYVGYYTPDLEAAKTADDSFGDDMGYYLAEPDGLSQNDPRTHRIQYFNRKIGGTSGGWLLPSNWKPTATNGETEPEGNALRSFHCDYVITLVDTAVQPVYNYIKAGNNNVYYRLQKQEQGIVVAPVAILSHNQPIDTEKYPYDIAEYDFSNFSGDMVVNGHTYSYWDPESGTAPATEYFFTIDKENPHVEANNQLIHNGNTWDDRWLDGAGPETWGDDIKIKAIHRNFQATLYGPDDEVTVEFKNGDDLLQSVQVNIGAAPEYTGEEPEKSASGVTYRFYGWENTTTHTVYAKDEDLPVVTGDVTYQAVFKVVLTITADDGEKTYDGSALTKSTFTVSGYPADLSDADKPEFTVTMTSDSTITNAGTKENVIATVNGVAVDSENPVEISGYYVLAANGTLTVNRKAVTITAASASKSYDGTALTNAGFTASALEEGDTHEFAVTMTADSMVSASGEQKANVIATVDGVNVMTGTETVVGNYLVTTVDGELSITSNTKEVKISSSTKSWKYDGLLHTDEVYTVTYDGTEVDADSTGKVFTLPTGDTVTITATAAGVKNYNSEYSENNTFTFQIENTEYYDNVTVSVGTLSIDKREVTLTSESGEKVYDGSPLTKPDVTVGGDGFVDGEVSDIMATGTVTNVADGEITNTITFTEGAVFRADNYMITKTEGKLTIKKSTAALVISSATTSWTYDSKNHKDETYTVTYGGTAVNADSTGKMFTLPTGDTVTITATAEGVKDYDTTYSENNTFTYELSNSGNYDSDCVTVNYGTLSIGRKAVTITAGNDEKYFDGKELTCSDFTTSDLEDGDTHTFTVMMTADSTITEKGVQPNVIATVDGIEVSTGEEIEIGNYLVTTADGTLAIYQGILEVEVTADPDSDVNAGDTVTFTVVVKNTGNTDDSGITLSHLPSAETGSNAESFDLAPGAQKTITYDYVVTQDDVDAGEFTRTTKATGVALKENEVEASDSATVKTVEANPELTVEETVSPSSGVEVGDTVVFTVTVTNTGNVNIKGISVEHSIAQTGSTGTFDLAPGSSKTLTYEYTVTQDDMDAGMITDTVTAEGTDPFKTAVKASDEAEATTAEASAKISVTKKLTADGKVAVGDTVTYTVTVANTGNVSVTDGKLEDTLFNLSDRTFALKPGETAEFTYDYIVTEADVETGSIKNTVKADATAVRGDDPDEVEASTEILTGRKALVITSADASWTYDGTGHTQDEYSVTYGGVDVPADDETGKTFTLGNGDTLTITSTAEAVKDYSTDYLANNTFTYTITNESQYDNVVSNYGTLTIEKRSVKLTSKSAEKTYDGEDLTETAVTVGGDGFVEGEVTDVKAEGIARNVSDGQVFNLITYTTTEKFNSGNYVITKDEGILQVLEREVTVTITGNSDSKPYNGELQSVYGYTAEISDPLYTEQDFDYYDVAVTGGVTVGEYPMVIVAEQFLNNNGNFVVTFVANNGKMTIVPNNSVVVKITGRDETVEYDGELHTFDTYDVEISDPIYTADDFEFNGNGVASGKDAGSYEMSMKPEDFVNTNSNFGTVTFEVVNGTLTVEPKEISIEWSEEREYPYDGKKHQPEAWVINLVDGDSCDVTVDGGQIEIGDDYIATAVALSNPNYKLPDTAQIPFEIYGCVVIFADDLGNELQVETVPYGELPSYDGEEPTKESYSAAYRYVFSGWDSEIVPVTERYTTYKAQFTEVTNGYVVKWVDGKGNVLKAEELPYGTKPEYTGETPTTVEREGYVYTFTGWSPLVTLVVEDVTYVAQFEEKAVKEYFLKSGDGSVHEKESGEGLKFVFSSNYDSETFIHFAEARVDGQTIPEDGYTASEGSLILELKPEYLDQLSVGNHTVSVKFDDYETALEAAFAVKEKQQQIEPEPTPKEPEPTPTEEPVKPAPQTGDTMNLYLIIGVIAAALVTILLIIFKRKRSEEE